MRSARDLIGLPVLDIVTGKKLGSVKDFLVSPVWTIHGLVLDYRTWFGAARFVEWKSICSVGADAITVNSLKSVKKFKRLPGISYLVYGKEKLTGLPLISAEGIVMGRVEDVYFSPKMEESIVGLELSDGFLTDLLEGRRKIPVPSGARRGEEAITVPYSNREEHEQKLY